jgi:hypothetical protein
MADPTDDDEHMPP